MIFFVILALTALFYFFVYSRQKSSFKGIPKDIPRVPGYPIIGNMLDFINLGPEATFKLLLEWSKKYGERFWFYLGTDAYVTVSNPEDLEVIMTSQKMLHKALDYNFFIPWLGTGLLISNEAKWFQRRKILTPAFHFKILDDFVDVFDKQADSLVEIFAQQIGRGEFDICPKITCYTLDVICEAAMGVKVNAQTDLDSRYVKSVVEISSLIYWRAFNAFARMDWYWKMTSQYKRHNELINIIHTFTNHVIDARREEMAKKGNQKDITEEDDIGTKKRFALLELLLRTEVDGKPLTNDDIREEVDNFMFAGHDTTTSAIEFLLYNIARHPEVQRKLFEELRSVFGDEKSEPMTLKKLNELKYFDLVLKESLRLHSPVPFIGRRMTEDVEINGRIYPKNTNINVAIAAQHLNPKYYPEPEKFIPERFEASQFEEKKNPFTYIPFAAGNRNCIGQKFAQLEIKSVISKLLRNFEIELGHKGFEPTIRAELIIKPGNGMWLKLKPRDYE